MGGMGGMGGGMAAAGGGAGMSGMGAGMGMLQQLMAQQQQGGGVLGPGGQTPPYLPPQLNGSPGAGVGNDRGNVAGAYPNNPQFAQQLMGMDGYPNPSAAQISPIDTNATFAPAEEQKMYDMWDTGKPEFSAMNIFRPHRFLGIRSPIDQLVHPNDKYNRR